MATPEPPGETVALFVTCLVDLFRPSVGFAAASLLESAGLRVVVPDAQTCCGQPAWNSGDRADARAIAEGVIAAFAPFDTVVAPSGSCAAMIKQHYPSLFADDDAWRARARALADKTWELTSFLHHRGMAPVASYDGVIAYHDSCSGLRELGVREQPRALLGEATVRELADREACCGFGGTFCVKYPEISDRMVTNKINDIIATGADTLVAGDLGCLMNMAGKLKREGAAIRVRHVAEILAGPDFHGPHAAPAIGEGER